MENYSGSFKFKHFLSLCLVTLQQLGFNPVSLWRSILGIPRYFINLSRFRRKLGASLNNRYNDGSIHRFGNMYPILNEFTSQAGTASGHYFHQDLYFARKIFLNKPGLHLDIGSRVDGFIAHLLSYNQQITLGDVRPLSINDQNLDFLQLDISKPIKACLMHSYSSISSLHVVEHIGLGRYGDLIDPWGHYKAVQAMASLLCEGGSLYLSFPTSKNSRIEYNAHRVISLKESLKIFASSGLVVKDFAYVDDSGCLNMPSFSSDFSTIDVENSYQLEYGCALWTLGLSH